MPSPGCATLGQLLALSVPQCLYLQNQEVGLDIPKCSSQLWIRILTSLVAHPHPEFQWNEYNRPHRKVHICPLLLGEEGDENRGCCFSQAEKGHPRGVLLAGLSLQLDGGGMFTEGDAAREHRQARSHSGMRAQGIRILPAAHQALLPGLFPLQGLRPQRGGGYLCFGSFSGTWHPHRPPSPLLTLGTMADVKRLIRG